MIYTDLFSGTKLLTLLTVAAMMIVLAAMMIDLANGLYKAKVRGDARRSYGLKRTLGKFLMYEGGMLVAYGIDLLMHFAHFWQLLNVETLQSVPVVTFLVAIFLLVVEGMSIREKADEKEHNDLKKAEDLFGTIIDRISEKAIDAIADRISNKIRKEE